MAGRSREDREADRNGMPMAKSEGLPKHEGERHEDTMKHMSGHETEGKDGKKRPGGKKHGRKSSRK